MEDQRAPDRAVEAGRGALFIGAAKVFFMVSGAAQQLLLARLVSAADYGVFEVVNKLISVLNNATVQGTIQSVSKFTAEDDSRAPAVKAAGLRLQTLVGLALGLAFFLGAPWIAAFYEHPEFTRWFRMVALIPVFYSVYSVFVGSANGLRKFRVQAGFDIGFSSLKTVLLLGGAAVFGVAGAFAGFTAAALVITIIAALVIGVRGARGFPVSRLLRFMGGMVLYTLLINLALNYDLLLLRRFLTVVPAGEANSLAGAYGAVRTLAVLIHQALIVATFVIFPLVSRSTFQEDRAATRAYVTQTLRYALILGAAMSAVLAARPVGLFGSLFRAEYIAGAPALPLLVGGILCLSLVGVAGAIINASGRPVVASLIVGTTVIIGLAATFLLVPAQEPGPAMLTAAAGATSLGMLAGLVLALFYLRRRFEAGPPVATLLRLAAAGGFVILCGRLVPPTGKLVNLALLAVLGIVFFAILLLLREFGPADRAKFAKILRFRR